MTVLFEKRNLPVVSVAFAVRNGDINENINEKGISHFIEHMLYKGTPKRNAKKIAEEIEKNGGELNGFTDEMITAYWCKMPSKHIDVALNVLSDMVKNPLFDGKELEKERKVIFEEIKMRKDNPMIYVFDKIQSCLYTGTLGRVLTYETLKSINRKKILEKFEQIYQSNNMILCVVGDTNINKIIEFAENNFGEIREKRNLAYAVKGNSNINKDFAYNLIYIGTTKENVEIVKKLILEEFEKISKVLTEEELKQVKEQIIGNYQISMEDSQSQMVNLLLHEIDGDAKKFYEFGDNIKKVKLKDVKKLANKVKEKKYSFFALVPED